MSKLQARECMTADQLTWLLCSVDVIPANKLSLQGLNKLIGIKLLTSGFPEIFGSMTQFPRGENACISPCGCPW